jgi:hypothetical protein
LLDAALNAAYQRGRDEAVERIRAALPVDPPSSIPTVERAAWYRWRDSILAILDAQADQ